MNSAHILMSKTIWPIRACNKRMYANIFNPTVLNVRTIWISPRLLSSASEHISSTALSTENSKLPMRMPNSVKGNTFKSKQQISDRIDALSAQGFYNVTAFATAEEYDLEALHAALKHEDLYEAKKFFSTDQSRGERDVLYVTAKYSVDSETRDIFFFRSGSLALWNFNEIETNNILSFVRPFEKDPYLMSLVKGESEVMPYTYIPPYVIDVEGDLVTEKNCNPTRAFFKNGKFFLTSDGENFLQKYTFSDALKTSIKLGIWEATLAKYVESIFFITEDLKKGHRIRITRSEALRKTGELFAIRHEINLASDCLDPPDFYWDREELEALYLQVCNYFSIGRRTKVMNEKINHCVELAELISHNLNDAHHIRLEWMIIILIMVEVAFEVLHFLERDSLKNNHALPIEISLK